MPLNAFCTDHKDTIAAAGVVVAFVGFVATAVGLGFTISQIRDARRALQASNAYQIQKDARELTEQLVSAKLDAGAKATPTLLSDYLYLTDKAKFEPLDDMMKPDPVP